LDPKPPPSHAFSHLLFFFNHPAPPHIYTLSLHDALPIFYDWVPDLQRMSPAYLQAFFNQGMTETDDPTYSHMLRWRNTARLKRLDRKSTRLNSSHVAISYAVFCLKKKKI